MLPDFRLERYFARWEFTARYNLAGSDAETVTVAELLALGDPGARDRLDRLRLGYIETWGTQELRHAVAGLYDGLGSENVLCFTGAEEGIFCAMHALLGPGDHAIVAVPNYQSVEEIPLSLCQVSGIALREREGWTIDPDELRALIRPTTRLIAVNFPNNPTGAMASPEVWSEVIAIARRQGAWLFSDEVYRGLERDGVAPLPPAAVRYERGLSLGVVSKALGLPGLRVGWIASPDAEALARMERVRHYLSICGAGPSELLAAVALHAADRLIARNRSLADRNLAVLLERLEEHPALFESYHPAGGCVMFPRYLGAEGADEMCRRMVEEAGVILLPGRLFASRLLPVNPDRFRVGFGRRDFAEGLAVLAAQLAR